MTTVPAGDADSAPRAAELYVADLRPRHGGRLVHALRLSGAAIAELAQGLIPAPSVHDVVVTRRDDGTEVLRVPAGEPLLAGDLLGRLRDELESMDAGTFLAGWSERQAP